MCVIHAVRPRGNVHPGHGAQEAEEGAGGEQAQSGGSNNLLGNPGAEHTPYEEEAGVTAGAVVHARPDGPEGEIGEVAEEG